MRQQSHPHKVSTTMTKFDTQKWRTSINKGFQLVPRKLEKGQVQALSKEQQCDGVDVGAVSRIEPHCTRFSKQHIPENFLREQNMLHVRPILLLII